MVFNPRSGSPAPNSVGSAQLQDNAVITSKIADNAVTSAEIADNAVITAKIADANVSTAKIANQAVTLLKTIAAVSRKDFFGTEVNYNHVGTTRKQFAKYSFAKDTSVRKGKDIKALVSAKVLNGANAADIELWVDSPDGDWNGSDVYTGAGSPGATATVTATTFTLHELSVSISALSAGLHSLRLVLKGAVAASDVTTDVQEFFVDPED